MMQEDELAILGDYRNENDEREKYEAANVILEYDEYEKQLMNEICGASETYANSALTIELLKQPYEVPSKNENANTLTDAV